MAYALWEHSCRVTGRTKQRDERWTCFRCRERAKLASVEYSMIERMGQYSRCYGVGSVGPHRNLADRLLKDITIIRCEPCAGTGDRIVGDEDVRDCWPCAGTGIAPESWEAIAQVREKVIEAYPASARPYPPERSSVVWQPRSATYAMTTPGFGLLYAIGIALLLTVGLLGGIGLLRGGRIIDGLFLLHVGVSAAYIAVVAVGLVTLTLRTDRVISLVLLAVFFLLFVLVIVHGVANAPA